MQAAAWAQTILYSIFIRAGEPKPQPGSVRFVKHRRQVLIAIYAAYFAFTIYEVDFNLQRSSNAYNDLGVPINVDETSLNSRFRKLTIRFHPDKIAAGIDREAANAYYIHLKHARDVILDPAKRFAYDRFGPDIFAQCQSCVTVKDYVDSALLSALTNYGVLLVFLIGANALGFLKDGSYWRYLGLLAVAAFEVRTAMRPDHPSILSKYLNPLVGSLNLRPAYLPFQVWLCLCLYIASIRSVPTSLQTTQRPLSTSKLIASVRSWASATRMHRDCWSLSRRLSEITRRRRAS